MHCVYVHGVFCDTITSYNVDWQDNYQYWLGETEEYNKNPSQVSCFLGHNLNPGAPKYKAEVLTTWPCLMAVTVSLGGSVVVFHVVISQKTIIYILAVKTSNLRQENVISQNTPTSTISGWDSYL